MDLSIVSEYIIGRFKLTEKLASVLMLMIIFMGLSIFAFDIPTGNSMIEGVITIGPDGVVSPEDSPIAQTDAFTYTFTGNPEAGVGLYVERDGVVVDGAGYALTGLGEGVGIRLERKLRVKIFNFTVEGFVNGISLSQSSLCKIINNTVTESTYNGIMLRHSHNNVIFNNTMYKNHEDGLDLDDLSYNNWVHGNTMMGNLDDGLDLGEDSRNNHIYNNNFRGNVYQVGSYKEPNYWNSTYPQGGNYWDNYLEENPLAKDEKKGPNQDQPGIDGKWDSPYAIYPVYYSEKDYHPLVSPYVVTESGTKVPTSIEVRPEKNQYEVGQQVIVKGAITPVVSGATVTVFIITPSNPGLWKDVFTESDGTFQYDYTSEHNVSSGTDVGFWGVEASWKGNEMYYGAESRMFSFEMKLRPGWPEVPGFPWESILIGLMFGVGTIYILRKKKLSISTTTKKTFYSLC
jgi:parallel beta-helix repeat protein